MELNPEDKPEYQKFEVAHKRVEKRRENQLYFALYSRKADNRSINMFCCELLGRGLRRKLGED